MTDISHEDALERKRRIDRERKAQLRAGMTPEERRAARREHDATYRDNHRERRRLTDREWKRQQREAGA